MIALPSLSRDLSPNFFLSSLNLKMIIIKEIPKNWGIWKQVNLQQHSPRATPPPSFNWILISFLPKLSTPVLLSFLQAMATKVIYINKRTGPKPNPSVLHHSMLILSENLMKVIYFFPSVEWIILNELFNLHSKKLGCFSNQMFK